MTMARLGAIAVALATTASIAGCNRGTIEGRLDYMDSTWDMGSPITATAPPIAVRLVPGDESVASNLLKGWAAARAGDPQHGIEPVYDGLADWVMSAGVPGGTVVDSVTVCEKGLFTFAKVKGGKYLALADYESDLGYFAWLVPVEIKGMTSVTVQMTWDNKIAIEVERPVPGATMKPPSMEEVEKIEEGIPPHPETIEVTVPNPPNP